MTQKSHCTAGETCELYGVYNGSIRAYMGLSYTSLGISIVDAVNFSVIDFYNFYDFMILINLR